MYVINCHDFVHIMHLCILAYLHTCTAPQQAFGRSRTCFYFFLFLFCFFVRSFALSCAEQKFACSRAFTKIYPGVLQNRPFPGVSRKLRLLFLILFPEEITGNKRDLVTVKISCAMLASVPPPSQVQNKSNHSSELCLPLKFNCHSRL